MPNFSPDQVSFGDLAGYGAFDIGHAREHLQLVDLAATALNPAVVLPNYDFLNFLTAGGARKAQLQAHWTAHELLNQIVGVTSIDYSEVDLDNPDDFYSWLGYHSTTHAQYRQFFGIT